MAKAARDTVAILKPQATWAGAARAQAVIDALRGLEGPLLPILHGLQHEFGYVPAEAEPQIAQALNLSRAEVHGVISFYHDFRHAPAGRHVLKLCRAEACQAMGGDALASGLLRQLGLDWGGQTADGALSVLPVFCLGLCACSPAALFDEEPVGRLDSTVLEDLVAEARG